MIPYKKLECFGRRFCGYLNPIFMEDGKAYHSVKPVEISGVYILPFAYAEKDAVPKFSDEQVDGFLESCLGETASTYDCPVLYYYPLKNLILIMKPAIIHYWTRAQARHDARNVLSGCVAAGY